MFDEIRIKEDLVYDSHQQEIIGFVDLGNVPNQLRAKERNEKLFDAKALEPDVAIRQRDLYIVAFSVRTFSHRLHLWRCSVFNFVASSFRA